MVIDTSALVSLVASEATAGQVESALFAGNDRQISTATRVELGIVIEARFGPAGTVLLSELLDRLQVRTVDLDERQSVLAIGAWRRYGKGRHPAGLNYGDCFSYALAKHVDAPLLFVGDDFSRTDIRSALL